MIIVGDKMIKIKNLKKTYKDRMVVDIDELLIPKGEIFGIVGGNGSGKTTLLKMIADLESKDEGFIDIKMNLNELVYLFQKPHLFNTSVYNNISYPLKFRKINPEIIKEKVDKIIEEFGLSELKNQNAKKLSGGEAQKVNLARALVFNPKLILLDEPTANIDPESTMQIEALLKNALENHNTSMVLVTHNISQVKRLCENVALMDKGKIIRMDKTEVILKSKILQYI